MSSVPREAPVTVSPLRQVWESLSEGLSKVESVPDVSFLDQSLRGELVHVSGPLSNVPILQDE